MSILANLLLFKHKARLLYNLEYTCKNGCDRHDSLVTDYVTWMRYPSYLLKLVSLQLIPRRVFLKKTEDAYPTDAPGPCSQFLVARLLLLLCMYDFSYFMSFLFMSLSWITFF